MAGNRRTSAAQSLLGDSVCRPSCIPVTDLGPVLWGSIFTARCSSLLRGSASAWQTQKWMLTAIHWAEHRVSNEGARESTQGAEGVCSPIGGTTIWTNQYHPQSSQGLNHQWKSTFGGTQDSSLICGTLFLSCTLKQGPFWSSYLIASGIDSVLGKLLCSLWQVKERK